MNELPAIITTDIIPSSADAMWEVQQTLNGLATKPVLVIAAQYGEGSGEEEQLSSIIKAGCKLQPQEYNIVRLPEGKVLPWAQVKEQLTPKAVLLFGVMPQQLGISALFRFCEVNNFGGSKWVPAYSLTQLMQDKAAKGQLWNNALKPLFETKTYGQIV